MSKAGQNLRSKTFDISSESKLLLKQDKEILIQSLSFRFTVLRGKFSYELNFHILRISRPSNFRPPIFFRIYFFFRNLFSDHLKFYSLNEDLFTYFFHLSKHQRIAFRNIRNFGFGYSVSKVIWVSLKKILKVLLEHRVGHSSVWAKIFELEAFKFWPWNANFFGYNVDFLGTRGR